MAQQHTSFMSKNLAELVNEFNSLSKEERTRFRDLIVRSNDQVELYGDISDEDIAAMGREAFRRLDEEENAAEARRNLAG